LIEYELKRLYSTLVYWIYILALRPEPCAQIADSS
jgi:hypothetical protein